MSNRPTDPDVLVDCARKLREAVDYCATRRGHLDDPRALDAAISDVAMCASDLEFAAADEGPWTSADHKELMGRMQHGPR